MNGSKIFRSISVAILIGFGVVAGHAMYALGFGAWGVLASLIMVSVVGAQIWITSYYEAKDRERILATIPDFKDEEITLPRNIIDAKDVLKRLQADREALIQAYIRLHDTIETR